MELIVQVPRSLAEDAAAQLVEAGASAVEQRDRADASVLITHIPLARGATARLRAMEARLAALGIGKDARALRIVEDRDWVAHARGQFRGEAHGRRLWVRPPWDERETPEGRIALLIEPGLSFGTGRHPSTRLALRAVEEACAHSPPERVVDVGCGSGILAVAALLCGAGRACALDLDPRAVEDTLALAEKNGLGGRIAAHNAALGPRPLADWWGRADFIAANIYLDALVPLAPLLREALAPAGRGVLAGVGYEQTEALARACREAGLAIRRTRRLGEWASVEIARA